MSTALRYAIPAWAHRVLAREASHAHRLLRIAQTQPSFERATLVYCLSGMDAVRTRLRIVGEDAAPPRDVVAYESLLETELSLATRVTPWANIFVIRREDLPTACKGVKLNPTLPNDAIVLTSEICGAFSLPLVMRGAEPPSRPPSTAMLTNGRVPFWQHITSPAPDPEPLPQLIRRRGEKPFYAFPHQIPESA